MNSIDLDIFRTGAKRLILDYSGLKWRDNYYQGSLVIGIALILVTLFGALIQGFSFSWGLIFLFLLLVGIFAYSMWNKRALRPIKSCLKKVYGIKTANDLAEFLSTRIYLRNNDIFFHEWLVLLSIHDHETQKENEDKKIILFFPEGLLNELRDLYYYLHGKGLSFQLSPNDIHPRDEDSDYPSEINLIVFVENPNRDLEILKRSCEKRFINITFRHPDQIPSVKRGEVSYDLYK